MKTGEAIPKHYSVDEIADAAIEQARITSAWSPMSDSVWLNDPIASMVSSSAQARIGRTPLMNEDVDDDPEYFEMTSRIEYEVREFIRDLRQWWRVKNSWKTEDEKKAR